MVHSAQPGSSRSFRNLLNFKLFVVLIIALCFFVYYFNHHFTVVKFRALVGQVNFNSTQRNHTVLSTFPAVEATDNQRSPSVNHSLAGTRKSTLSLIGSGGLVLEDLYFHSENDRWMDHWHTVSKELWIFSGYFDDRKGVEPMIRIIATGAKKPKQAKAEDYACYGMWNIYEELILMKHKFRYILAHSKTFSLSVALLVECYLTPTNITSPIAITVVPVKTNFSEIDKSNMIQVHRSKILQEDPKRSEKLAVCVRPIYGSGEKLYRVAEWMAIWKLLGASHFSFYDYKMDHRFASFFRYLRNKGGIDLDLIPWKLESPIQNTSWAAGQMEFSTECAYHHAYKYDLVAIVDFDEFFIPLKDRTLIELFKRKELSGSKTSSYCILQSLMCPPNDTVYGQEGIPIGNRKPELVTQTWLTRDSFQKPCGGFSKYIVRPARSLIESIHLEEQSLPSFHRISVPTSLVANYHYRIREEGCDGKVVADHPKRYATELNNSEIFQLYKEFLEKS